MASIRNDLGALCPECGAGMVLGAMQERECIVCGRKEVDREACANGHFVCDECRRKMGSKAIRTICMGSASKDPAAILIQVMGDKSIRMHDLKHHVAVGAVLLTAYRNAGGDIDLEGSLREMDRRGSWFPGGLCGLAGTCGAAASAGAFYSIVTGTTPHSGESWGRANLLVSECLQRIGSLGGPRCCKRNSFIAIEVATQWARRDLGVPIESPGRMHCPFSDRNDECIRERCPFFG